ncbi:hypothetical protein KFE25_012723 [Diacronema lutheri]|uniref:4Fe-4S ferredoxin-type domain-containing protein n=3 Tax=Diacronema lutheri TaxID=2081491 RepID=A0A8J6C804_DIALT|nr:hypothetical protein KFE25_012723 [Diacronema lutheri]
MGVRSRRRSLVLVFFVVSAGARVAAPLAALRPFVSTRPTDALASLRTGGWFKLICGAANQDVVAIRNLVAVFALAGADCVDMSADPAVLRAARSGVLAAAEVAGALGLPAPRPWLMVSVQDGRDDLHFRKAVIGGACPADCDRPCERVCPADAFRADEAGAWRVLAERCYGCGRCLPVCPYDLLSAEQQPVELDAVRRLLPHVDALEVHTRPGHVRHFAELWAELGPSACEHLTMLAVSTPQLGARMGDEMAAMDALISSGGARADLLRMWQLDGRPMSGDVGAGATVPAVELAAHVSRARPLPFGDGRYFVSVAGGTNDRTVDVLRSRGLRSADGAPPLVHGVAYGSYARRRVGRVLAQLPDGVWAIEEKPELLAQAVEVACALVQPLKA